MNKTHRAGVRYSDGKQWFARGNYRSFLTAEAAATRLARPTGSLPLVKTPEGSIFSIWGPDLPSYCFGLKVPNP